MKKMILLLFIVFAANLHSNELSQKNELFDKYLKDNYSMDIPKSKHLFFVVSAIGCETCKKLDFDYLHKLSERSDLNIIISYPRRAELPESVSHLAKKPSVLLDRGRYFKWNITPSSDAAIIITENGKISRIFELSHWTSRQIEKIIEDNLK